MQKHHHWTLTPKALICNSHPIICSDVGLFLLCLHTGPSLHTCVVPTSMHNVLLASHKFSLAQLTTH